MKYKFLIFALFMFKHNHIKIYCHVQDFNIGQN